MNLNYQTIIIQANQRKRIKWSKENVFTVIKKKKWEYLRDIVVLFVEQMVLKIIIVHIKWGISVFNYFLEDDFMDSNSFTSVISTPIASPLITLWSLISLSFASNSGLVMLSSEAVTTSLRST